MVLLSGIVLRWLSLSFFVSDYIVVDLFKMFASLNFAPLNRMFLSMVSYTQS